MSREADWIRNAARGDRPALGEQERLAFSSLDAETVARIAYAHQVGPWLVAALQNGEESLPEAASALSQVALRQTAITLAHQAVLLRLLRALTERGVDAIVLKGPALARAVYPQDGLRPYRDVDLLVHHDDVATVTAMLEARGYRDRYPDASEPMHAEHGAAQRVYEDSANGLRVEVHSDHLQIGVEPVGMAAIWSRSERSDFGGAGARVLEQHDLFVHLCLHLHRHSFSRLIWFKDLDLLVRQGGLDWACVRERAIEQGCIDSVSLSLELLEAVLGTPLPPEAQALAKSRARWTRWLQRIFWPARRSVDLELQRRWRLRRLVQFAPEAGVIRGGLPSLLFTGRRRAKLRVLASALPGRRRR